MSPSFELNGAVAVVTGASSGLGRRFAEDLARAGAVVVGIARRRQLLEELEERLRRASPRSTTRVCDVSHTEIFTTVLAEVELEHGRVDLLVNDAGIGEQHEGAGVSKYRSVMDTNYFGAVAGTLAVLPGMMERRHGAVVNVSSDSGRAPGPDEPGYSASKAALSAFTEAMAIRIEGSGVHLHVLYPGWVPTAMASAALDGTMRMPPKAVRRTEEQVSRLMLERVGGRRIDIDATVLARLAPVARVVAPSLYRRGVRAASG